MRIFDERKLDKTERMTLRFNKIVKLHLDYYIDAINYVVKKSNVQAKKVGYSELFEDLILNAAKYDLKHIQIENNHYSLAEIVDIYSQDNPAKKKEFDEYIKSVNKNVYGNMSLFAGCGDIEEELSQYKIDVVGSYLEKLLYYDKIKKLNNKNKK